MEYDNTNTGILFKNDKATSDKSPTHTGKINIDGRELRLAAWVKEGKNGKFLSLKVSEFTNKPEAKPVAKAESFAEMPDDLPF
jgi:hypothetical protein